MTTPNGVPNTVPNDMPNANARGVARIAARVALTSFALASFALASFATVARAQGRAELTINDTGVAPENLTSSRDGTVYFGSTAKGTIYRATPGAAQAEPWILASTAGLTNVLGVLADDRSNTLWVCQNATGGRGGAPAAGTGSATTCRTTS